MVVRKDISYIGAALAIITITGCTKVYTPAATTVNYNFLVVDGIINVSDSTIIKLSRTVPVNSSATTNPETGAAITIENAQGTVYKLTEATKGTYVTPALNLDNTKQYRLRIVTKNGKTYLSDLVDTRVTPVIDSVGNTVSANGLQIYVNSHDAQNATHYYKYSYQETWYFRSEYLSNYVSNGKQLMPRTTYVQFCYGVDYSTNIILNSTAALSQDVVYQYPLIDIPSTSEKFEYKYSVLVSQIGLTKPAFDYWSNLEKNTEKIGSIFGPQPSETGGNIHNVADATEPVMGYISSGTVQKKRVFISRTQLPQNWQVVYPYACEVDGTSDPAGLLVKLPNPYTPLFPGTMGLFMYTTPQCGDCSSRGSLTQPSYWQ